MNRLFLKTAAVVVLCAHLGLSHSHNYRVAPDDDRLWLYQTGAEIGQADVSRALTDKVRASMRATGASAVRTFRFEAREAYHRNYVAASGLYAAAQAGVRAVTRDLVARDYPAYLAIALVAGYALSYFVVVVAFVGGLLLTRRDDLLLAGVTAVAAMAGLEIVFDLAGDRFVGLPNLLPVPGSSDTLSSTLWPNFVGLILNPQVGFSPFGDNPRNHILLLTIPVFALRWSERLAASYFYLLLLSFLHQSMAGLMFGFLVGVDALLRPGIFASPVGVIQTAIFLIFVSRERLGAFVGLARPPALAALAAAALAIAIALWLGAGTPVRATALVLSRTRERLRPLGIAGADLVCLASIWIITLPLAYAINARMEPFESIYFWAQLHGRALALLRVAFILGAGLYVVNLLSRRYGPVRAAQAVVAASALLLAPSAFLASTHRDDVIPRIEQELRAREQAIGPAIDWTRIGSASESEMYYALGRELDRRRLP